MSLAAKLAAALSLIVALICSHWYVYHAGNRNGSNAAMVGVLEASNAALAKRVAENEALRIQQSIDTEKANQSHADEIKTIRAIAMRDANQRVPVSAEFCNSIAGATEAITTGSNGQATTGGRFLPKEFTDDLQEAAVKSDEVVADLRHLIRRVEDAECFK